MSKKLLLIFTLLMVHVVAFSQRLLVSQNQRYLVTDEGKPFLWLGDTAWELFHRLDREEATQYLTKRAEQGFSVIQAVVLAENDGLRTPNAYGALPLEDLSPEKPNEDYFKHVDFIVDKANELGLYVGMLPTWGDKLYSLNPGAGPIIFNPSNAETFGEYLGNRYKDKQIVWILGGDRTIANLEVLEIWRAMAKGIQRGDGGKNLISFHPRGAHSSSEWVHNEDWLDFNMYQSGHSRHFTKVYDYATSDYLLKPIKPFIEGEPAYEDIPLKFWEYMNWQDPMKVPEDVLDEHYIIQDTAYFEEGYFTDYDVRVHAYWNLLSGACGYTYGNNAVWQMFEKGGYIAIPCLTDWKGALDRPGANDIQHIRTLFTEYDFSMLIPDQSIIYGINPNNEQHIRAAVAQDSSFLIAYLSVGQEVSINMVKVKQPTQAIWFNPRNGEQLMADIIETDDIHVFTPPSQGKENDWVLILEEQ